MPGARALEEAGIPAYAFPEPAVEALASMALLAGRRHSLPEPARYAVDSAKVRSMLRPLKATQGPRLGLLALAPLLGAYGIACAVGQAASTPREATVIAERLGFPVALKILSPDIIHKTEVGGVMIGLNSAEEVSRGADTVLGATRPAGPTANIAGLLVQPMVPPGRELLLGMIRDSQFGPSVTVGFGGIYVEVLKDTVTRLAPLLPDEALEMLDGLRMAPLLHGVRGEPPVNHSALADTICRFAQLAVDVAELREIELNPLVASPSGVVVLDARGALE